MATYVQRTQAIADALLNRTATPAQVQRLVEGVIRSTPQTIPYDGATNAQKGQMFIETLRKHLLAQVKQYEGNAAVKTAQDTTAQAVDTEFTEA